ncbi:MAG: hypothetical protein WAM97_18290 [Acidimicrobiales bacterium]
MKIPKSLLRATPVLALLVLASGCSHPAATPKTTTTTTLPKPGTPANPVPPVLTSVKHGKFVSSVTIGGGVLEVTPPPKDAQASLDAAAATSIFDSDDTFTGIYAFDIVGLGEATLSASAVPTTSQTTSYRLQPLSTPTTSAPTTTTTATPATTTPTTTAPTTPTTAPPVTTPTTAPPPAFPSYDKRLAWVGIAVGQTTGCDGAPGVVAVIMDADTGHDVVNVTIAGCGSTAPPAVARASQLQSIAWTLVGVSNTGIVVQVPACGSYVGWTNVTMPGGPGIQVQASVPYDPQCANASSTNQTVSLVVPANSGQTSIPHAPIGPIDDLESLVSS